MSCEYENRCLNSSRCFRCYGNKLLKLPKDKTARSKKVFSHKIANSDNSWEDLEQNIADELSKVPNIEEVKRSRASGARNQTIGSHYSNIMLS